LSEHFLSAYHNLKTHDYKLFQVLTKLTRFYVILSHVVIMSVCIQHENSSTEEMTVSQTVTQLFTNV